MLKKFYAKRSCTVDGRTYNAGEIVMSETEVDGLERANDEQRPAKTKKKRYERNARLGERNPELSVVVTFHNQLEFVDQCLDSFHRQNFDEAYEVIAVIDKSEQAEAEYIKKHFPTVDVCEVSYGNANKARNFGLSVARGKYVAFFDGDDYAYGNYLLKLRQALRDNPSATFSYARFEHELYGLSFGSLPRCNVFEWNKSWAKFSPITNTPILIYRDRAPKWDERLEIMQDAGYCLELTKAGFTGVHVREELWHYRNHKGGIWNQAGIAERRANANEILRNEYGFRNEPAKVTFVSLISRDVVLDEYFGQIKTLGLPPETHWFILVDSNQEPFIEKIKAYQAEHEGQFLSSRMFVTGEDSLSYSRDFESRGMRIANFIKIIINQAAQKMGGSEFLFMVEDDTLVPENAYGRLLPLIKRGHKTVYASGIECGRGFTKHTGICWLKKNDKGEITGRTIPSMKTLKGVVEIGGGGWYCWIGRARELQHWTTRMPMRCFDGKMLGPDVMMAHDLQQFGYSCLCDTTLQCDHYDERRKVWLPASTGKGYDIEYYKDKSGDWKMLLKETDDATAGIVHEMKMPKL
jgi:glycosyltransferase involved in cell wall biosynthesis